MAKAIIKGQDFTNLDGFAKAWKSALKYLKPPPDYTPAEWAEANVKIPLGNAIPGPLRFDNAPYQVEPINCMADPATQRVTLMWGAQLGKLLDVDTPIPTPHGWKRMGNLRVGEQVFGPDGNPTKVTYVSPRQCDNKQYEIEFTDGTTILAGEEHEWTVDIFNWKGRIKAEQVTLTTGDMLENYVRERNGKKRYRYGIRNTKPLIQPKADLPIDPYTLGIWLGDGSADGGVVWIGDKDKEILSWLPHKVVSEKPGSGCKGYRLAGLHKALRLSNLTRNKHIPDQYMFASYDQRLALLRGLMDSDGTCKGNACEISLSDERLARDVHSLINSMGIKVAWRSNASAIYGERKKDRYRLGFTAYPDTLIPFRLKRYIDQFNPADPKRAAETLRRRITRITEQKDKVDMVCISVDNASHLYLAGRQMIPTHNTQIVNCTIGYYVAHNPQSQMMMQPSQGDLHTWLETKFNPMVDTTPALNNAIAKPRSREGVNNQAMKSYPGGFLMFSWSGSPKTMRGRSAPIIYTDEVDGYDKTAEGHPVSLLWQRAATFGDQRKLLVTSTPTIKGASYVEDSFLDGDQRRYYIPCPHCDTEITLKWSQVVWDKAPDGTHLPETATYACQECGGTITDGQKRAGLRKGRWIAAKPFRGHASFHLSELYSGFRKWSDIVTSFLEKKAVNDIQTFTNVSLAETFEDVGEQLDDEALDRRREDFGGKIPEEVVILTAGVDVQDNRLEFSLIGWARNDETYVLQHEVLYGDPSTNQLWTNLSSRLFSAYQTHDGRQLAIRAIAIDSGGHFTNSVYQYAKKNAGHRVFAVKGVGGEGRPLSGKPSKNNIARCPLFPVGVDTAKDLLFKRLKINEPGPGYVHFDQNLPNDYFLQLTAEKITTRFVKGFKKREYQKTRERNEALDCFVYAIAAYAIINLNVNALADRIHEEPVEKPVNEPKKQGFVPKMRGKSFVNGWR